MATDDRDTDEERSEGRDDERTGADDEQDIDAEDADRADPAEGPGPEDRPGTPDPEASERRGDFREGSSGTYVNAGRETGDQTRGQAWNAQDPRSRQRSESRGPPEQSSPRQYGSQGSPPSRDQPRRYGSRPSRRAGGPEDGSRGASQSRSSEVPIGGMRESESGRSEGAADPTGRAGGTEPRRTREAEPPAEGARPPVEGEPAPERSGSREPSDRSTDDRPKRTQPLEEPSDVEPAERAERAETDEAARSEGDERSEPPKYGGPLDPNWERKRNRAAASQQSQREYERRLDRQLDRQRQFQVDKSGGRYRRK
jgi:hypothetical protein